MIWFFFFILNLFQNTDPSNNYLIDTRSFLYIEIFNHFKNDGNIFIGNGGFANYYTYWFDFISSLWKHQRANIGYLWKWVFINTIKRWNYLFVITLFINLSNTTYAVNNSRNKYLKNLSFIVISFLFTSSYENVLAFDTLNVSFWIMLSLLYSKNINNLTNEDIQIVFKKL